MNREYIKSQILKHTSETRIKVACEKLSNEINIPDYIIYNFTRASIPREKDLAKLITILKLDLKILFNI
ncbi:hypothetical protein [Candidatus Clostridium helianthi]|uniref:XRE family transcriptional regulator n=1 Tax=Candidatus Clostridium helianthi TaxID=3381660 RepID=A0ABW8S784_9CLOT